MQNSSRGLQSLFLALLVFLSAASYVLLVTHQRLDVNDESWLYYTAHRVGAGQVPYRDFHLMTTPAAPYLFASFFRFGGETLDVAKLALAAGVGLIAVAVFLLSSTVAGPTLGMAIALTSVLSLTFNTYTPYALLFGLAALVLCVRPSNKATAFAAGVACGVSFLFKQNAGVFFLAAALYTTGSVWALAGFATVAGMFGLWLFSYGALQQFVEQAVFGLTPILTDYSAPSFSLTVAAFLVFYASLAWLAIAHWRNTRDSRLKAVIAFSTAASLLAFPLDVRHLIYLAPFAALLFSWVVNSGVLGAAKPAYVLIALVLVYSLAAVPAPDTRSYEYKLAVFPAGSFWTTKAVEDELTFLNSVMLESNGSVFIESMPSAYFLTRTENPLKIDFIVPPNGKPGDVKEAIRDLQDKRVQAVVLRKNRSYTAFYSRIGWQELQYFVERNYVLAYEFKNWMLYVDPRLVSSITVAIRD